MFLKLRERKPLIRKNKIKYKGENIMKIEANILSRFKGEINGIEIFNENSYNIILNVLEAISKKFKDVELDNEFIHDLENEIENYSDVEELENDLLDSIYVAKEFSKVEFIVSFEEYEKINNKIKSGAYLK